MRRTQVAAPVVLMVEIPLRPRLDRRAAPSAIDVAGFNLPRPRLLNLACEYPYPRRLCEPLLGTREAGERNVYCGRVRGAFHKKDVAAGRAAVVEGVRRRRRELAAARADGSIRACGLAWSVVRLHSLRARTLVVTSTEAVDR
jgi:hypothetical protein